MIHKWFGRLQGPGKNKFFSMTMKSRYLSACLYVPPTHLCSNPRLTLPWLVSHSLLNRFPYIPAENTSFWLLGEQEAAHIAARSELHVLTGRPTNHADWQVNRLNRTENFWVHAAAFSTPGALIWVLSLLPAAKFHSNCRNLTLWPLSLYQMQLKLSGGFKSY